MAAVHSAGTYTSYEDRSKAFAATKRLIDFLGAFIALLLTMPVWFFIGVCYMFGENKGSVFFKQQRIGKNGEKFYIYKFRSMVMNADQKLRENKELYAKYIDNSYKLEPHEDPRITKFGEFLRKTSLDEIPQIINVLKGEMSLIGPRPVIKDELAEYGEKANQFLSVKPGMSGYWQVCGRSSVHYPERVEVELYYVENQSMKLEAWILLKTVEIVLLRKGAY
ncbi:sugar transferase [Domibacillus epiphyticus]|uniref:Multidrug MFS transporter n=1 Tax=Domibacillus epiphyticus TaxID=1714355 RepID=A0A1V2A5B1_9BACI|nr:multidrug MFS transporter [Domibacillus epiphyticus]